MRLMKLLIYNIRYGTGGKKPLFPWSGYLGRTHQNLAEITEFIRPIEPDIIWLIEVDSGSYRASKLNQAQTIAQELGHYHTYRSKYLEGARLPKLMPLMNNQGNAFITRDTITNERFHYFEKGVKRLVIELEMDNVIVFLVHLALSHRVRHHQLRDLYKLVKETKKPHIVAGDFNMLWGEHEIELFLAATGLESANVENTPSFPSWAPSRHLDFILYSKGIAMNHFEIPTVTLSDHLPLLCDFTVTGS
jgi:endonuclease/exonuclease/phosphatase family metal-dependent hydrolase